jgi:hypothetical protein
MDFLYVDRNVTLVTAILGVLYFKYVSVIFTGMLKQQCREEALTSIFTYFILQIISKSSRKHYISTFHIGPSYLDQEPPIYVGTSEIGSNHLLSVLLLKGLPDLPYCMVYVDVSLMWIHAM